MTTGHERKDESVIFNFGVLLERGLSDELVAYSRAIGAIQDLAYVLGERSLPHVTILQFPAPLSEAEALWRELAELPLPPLRLHFHGLSFDRFRAWDGLWLKMKHCPELREVQRAAIGVLGDRHYINGTGKNYEPHATVAAWLSEDRLPALPIAPGLLDRADVTGFYTLGVSGPNFQYERKLHGKS